MSIKELLYDTDVHNIKIALNILEIDLSITRLLWETNNHEDKIYFHYYNVSDTIQVDYFNEKYKIIKSKLSKYYYCEIEKDNDLFIFIIKKKIK